MPSLTYEIPSARSPITVELYKQITTLGRGRQNDICVPDPLLAEEFAHIHFDGQHFTLSTLSRKDAFLVNGRSRKQTQLKHGDQLQMGSTDFSFRMFSERPAQEPKALEPLEAYRKLYQFSKLLMLDHSLDELLNALLDQVIEVTNAERGFIILLEGNIPKVAVGRNVQKESLADATKLYSDSIVEQVAREKKPLILSDALHDEKFKGSTSVVNLQLSSVMCVPMMERGRLLGVIYVGNSKITALFDRSSLELLMIFAAQASLIIQKALLINELQTDNQKLATRLHALQGSGIIGGCEEITEVLRKVSKVATTDVSVLVTGETGTGKELIAKEIHRLSNRAKGPFVTINCGAIPENLLESELFGHVKGAFTGAVANKIGKFQAADGGTLFLDELGEMPLNLQVKLLRALEDKKITRVGDTRPEQVDIRIVAATNRHLEEEVRQGHFREDLYYRLNVINIHLPPLRTRGDDTILLARFFLQRFANEYNCPAKGFSPGAVIAMKKYRWPGNIRELENRIRKAVILAEGTHIDASDLDIPEEHMEPILNLADAKERFQAQYINEVLARNNGNRTKTAKDLGVDPRTIFRHLEKEQEKDQKTDDPLEP
ncbi:MAG: sigma 54-interacting transcriptional regulator [Myxococcales bacterium]|nr:sigma 54-interacting transcriptional regulator [Myxococcales bacterium]MCB9642086.1 sigma 54-interacting transcriptional regulator [Myxococcales bacterium]